MGYLISMRFSVSCSILWLKEVLKDSKRWQERSNFDEFLNSNVYLKFVDKRFRPGGRFLLVSPEWVIRFRCGFLFLVAYCGWKKSWNIQNVGCNGRILVNFWIRMCYVKFVDKRYRQGGRFLLVSPKRVVRFRCGFRCLVAYSGWKKPC